jgi:hypothetical protein
MIAVSIGAIVLTLLPRGVNKVLETLFENACPGESQSAARAAVFRALSSRWLHRHYLKLGVGSDMKTFAARILEKNERLRETLNTKLYRELKNSLPKRGIYGKTYRSIYRSL